MPAPAAPGVARPHLSPAAALAAFAALLGLALALFPFATSADARRPAAGAHAALAEINAQADAAAQAKARRHERANARLERSLHPAPSFSTPTPLARPAAPAPAPVPAPAPQPPAPAPPGPDVVPPRPGQRAPRPRPVPDGTAAGWNGFGVGSWPSASWRPYADSSPFNRLVGGAATHARSAALVRKILSWGTPAKMVAGASGTSDDYGHPTYWSQPGDPLFTLRATGTPNEIQGMRIPIPDAAQPARGSDGHMTVVTPDGWEYDFWQVASKPRGGGTLTFAIGGRIPIDGDGLDGKGTASLFGNLAGIIRAQEMAAGRIDHALFVVLKCASSKTDFGHGTQPGPGSQSAYVYPALHGAARCSSSEDADAPPLGARIHLTMSDAEIAALAVPAWRKTILTALARYGGYVGDTGGSGFGLMFESGATYTSFGVADPLVDFARANGLPASQGRYTFDVAAGVDWMRYLRVVAPPAP